MAAESKLRTSQSIDLSRIGKISQDERSLLRLEWRSDVSRVAEENLLDEMIQRLGRMESTTQEISQLVMAIPAPEEIIASAPERVNLEPQKAAADFKLKLALGAGTSLLLLLAWLLRRRPAAANDPTGAVYREPTLAPTTSGETSEKRAVASSGHLRPDGLAVSPEPTFAPSPMRRTPIAEPDASDETNNEADSDPQEALELAELMLSMGLANGAAQALSKHIRSNPKQALYHWLKLLDVYRMSGNKFQFEKSTREIQQHFNIQAENWAQLHRGGPPTLESFPRIACHIENLWHQPEAAASYLKGLLEDNRGGTRTGFPQPAAEEILLLIGILKEESASA